MDEVFSLMGSLNNLALIKIAHDQGIPVDIFDDYVVDWNYGQYDHTWDNFITALEYLFDNVEYLPPYDDNLEEKKYWVEQVAGAEGVYDDTMVVVCLDDDIRPFQPFNIGLNSYLIASYAEIYPIERGFILLYHDDDGGEIDVVEAFIAILEQILNRDVWKKEWAR